MTLFTLLRSSLTLTYNSFPRTPGKVTTFGQKNGKPVLVMTLVYTARVITDPDLELFFPRMPGKVTNFSVNKVSAADVPNR